MTTLMTKAEFARLCQVSEPMMSPRKYGPYLVMVRGKVDARATLMALEGRLDAAKWRAARDKLDAADKAPPPLLAAPDRPALAAGDDAGDDDDTLAEPKGWKARGDMFKAKEAELSYHERVGALVPADEVGAGIEAVIADFWTETERRVKLDAAEIASDLKLDAERAARLRTLLTKKNRDTRADFARVCRAAEKRFLAAAEAVA